MKVVQSKYVGIAKYCSRECQARAGRSHDWSEADEEFVRQNYPFQISLKEIADKFDVSVSAVQRLVKKLNLPKVPISLRSQRVSETTRYWTRKRIIEEIKKISKAGPINSSYVQERYGSLHNLACDRFGSWGKAVESAGFDYEEVNLYSDRKTWATEDIIQQIHRLRDMGEDLKASHIRDAHADLFNAARRDPALGTWEAAIEEAGLSYDGVKGDSWGTPYRGVDGFLYASETEGLVGDRLYNLLVRGIISGYQNQVRVTDDRAWTCDFVIELIGGDCLWMEVDGLGDARRDGVYGKGHEKIAYYEAFGYMFAIVRTPGEAEDSIFGQ